MHWTSLRVIASARPTEGFGIRRLAPQLYYDQRIVGLAPHFVGSDRVDGSGFGAIF
jgi:hypothetical protein